MDGVNAKVRRLHHINPMRPKQPSALAVRLS